MSKNEATENIKIAIRVRPFNRSLEHEKDPNLRTVVVMDGRRCYIYPPTEDEMGPDMDQKPKEGQFNYCLWSHDPNDDNFYDQERVYNTLGVDVLETLLEGYNVCLFAYGQSGSGKTFSMTGSSRSKFSAGSYGSEGELEGIIPRCTSDLIKRCQEGIVAGELLDFRLSISIVQIYLEKVTDLLATKGKSSAKDPNDLKIGPLKKEGKIQFGWGVPDAERHEVLDYDGIAKLLDMAEKKKVTHATGLNGASSRGHTILTAFLVRTYSGGSQSVCKLNLVDLAGSERLGKTGVTGLQEEEGKSINLSLTTLGKVIRALGKKKEVPPYRESKLTNLLKESLSVNCKTVMIAAINPCPGNYEESVSTLGFADGVSRVKLPAKKQIISADKAREGAKEMEDEIRRLQEALEAAMRNKGDSDVYARRFEEMESELQNARDALAKQTMSYSERRAAAVGEQGAIDAYLARMGLAEEKIPDDVPRITNMSEDPFTDGKLKYGISIGCRKLLGKRSEDDEDDDEGSRPQILLEGPQVARNHCIFENLEGTVFIEPLFDRNDPNFEISVNGKAISSRTALSQDARIWIGNSYVFHFVDPSLPPSDVKVTYKFAYTELLKRDGYKDPEEVERQMREEEARIRQELEAKMESERNAAAEAFRVEQERMRAELEASAQRQNQAEAKRMQEEFEEKKKQMEEERRKLEEQLEKQKREALEAEEAKRRDAVAKTRLENQLTELIPLIRQANLFATELRREVEFQGKLRPRSEISLAGSRRQGTYGNVECVVEVRKKWNNSVSYLGFEEFKDRYQMMVMTMQEVTRALQTKEPLEIDRKDDPFYFAPSPVVLGQAFLFMFVLATGMGTAIDPDDPPEESPITDISDPQREIGIVKYRIERNYTSEEQEKIQSGKMDVENPQAPDIGEEYMFTIGIEEIEDIKFGNSNQVYLDYKFFHENRTRCSEVVHFSPGDQKIRIKFDEDFKVIVTESLLDYFNSDPILVQIWGTTPETKAPPLLSVNTQNSVLDSTSSVLVSTEKPGVAPPNIRSSFSAGSSSGLTPRGVSSPMNDGISAENKRLRDEVSSLKNELSEKASDLLELDSLRQRIQTLESREVLGSGQSEGRSGLSPRMITLEKDIEEKDRRLREFEEQNRRMQEEINRLRLQASQALSSAGEGREKACCIQ